MEKESKKVKWFSLFERMGVCPAIRPVNEKIQKLDVYVKPEKYPFKDKNVRLEK